MDIDDPAIASSQAMSQPTCPYRPPAGAHNGPSPFRHNWSHNPHLDLPIPPFNPASNPSRLYWGAMSPHTSHQHESLANGNNHPFAHTGRPGNATRFDYAPINQQPLDFSNPPRFQHSDESRRPIPRIADMDRFHSPNDGRQGENHTPGTIPPINTVMPTYSSPDSIQGTNEYFQGHMARSQQEAQANRIPRPPPTLTIQSTFFPTHLPQPNFASNRNFSFLPQEPRGSTSQHTQSIPIPVSSERRQQFDQAQRRAWVRESNISSDYTEDSDEDSVDSLNGRPDNNQNLGSQPSHLRHAAASGHSHRRPAMSSFEGEEREIALERARAARRGAMAAAKMVASSAALASLEQVDLSSLSGDDRNCIICYNEFGIMNPDGHIECAVRLPKCKHVFGDHCLKHWLKDSDSCPYCRDKLPSEPKKNPADETRHLFVLNRQVAASSQQHGGTADERAALVGTENQNTAQPLLNRAQMQSQLQALYAFEAHSRSRMENAATDQSGLVTRHNIQRQEEWAAPHAHAPTYVPPRSIPDHDSRRRNRQRASSIRSSTTNNQTRLSNPALLRSGTRDGVPQNPHIHAAPANSPRSVTPHPNVLGTLPTFTFPGLETRRSSLPSESSPLREATLADSQQQQDPHGNAVDATGSMLTHSTSSYGTSFTAGSGVFDADATAARMQDLSAWSGRPMSESYIGGASPLGAGREDERAPISMRQPYGMR